MKIGYNAIGLKSRMSVVSHFKQTNASAWLKMAPRTFSEKRGYNGAIDLSAAAAFGSRGRKVGP